LYPEQSQRPFSEVWDKQNMKLFMELKKLQSSMLPPNSFEDGEFNTVLS